MGNRGFVVGVNADELRRLPGRQSGQAEGLSHGQGIVHGRLLFDARFKGLGPRTKLLTGDRDGSTSGSNCLAIEKENRKCENHIVDWKACWG